MTDFFFRDIYQSLLARRGKTEMTNRKATSISAEPQSVADYWHLFVNRRAYTLQSQRPHPESGRHHYYQPKEKETGAPLPLTEETIRRHLEGEVTLGLYAINPTTQCCKWVAIDADYMHAMEDLLKLQYHLSQDKVEPALEMSKRGGHLWIFLETPLAARDCRVYIHDLASRLGVPVKGSGLADGIEVFPRHDTIAAGEFGNAIRAPLGIHRGAQRRFWFYGADYTIPAQLTYLKRLRKVTAEELQRFTAGKQTPEAVTSKPTHVASHFRAGQSEFRILEHVTPVRKVGRNYVARCPACAAEGNDRSGDNLAILIADPRYYKCWAGCNKEMIRAACGCPIAPTQR